MKAAWTLAWRQLMKEKRRLAAAVAGISFAVILMLVQLGFEQALFKSLELLYGRVNAEVVLVSPNYQNMLTTSNFTRHRLEQAVAAGDVEWTAPMYLSTDVLWKNPIDHTQRPIMLIGIPPRRGILNLPELDAQIDRVKLPDTVLFDSDSRPEFGPVAELLQQGPLHVDLAQVTTNVAGTFHLGTSFATDGNLITSDTNFQTWLPNRDPSLINLGWIHLKPGVDPIAFRTKLQGMLPHDITVLTREQLIDQEKTYWAGSTPIGFVFRLGLIMGLIVGSVVVYQILYSDISEHLSEYATLKAMGYTDRFLSGVVLQESLILSVMGFLPGMVLSQVVYGIAYHATRLPLHMDPARVIIVYLLTAAMCVFSGMLATRRLRLADPAEIF